MKYKRRNIRRKRRTKRTTRRYKKKAISNLRYYKQKFVTVVTMDDNKQFYRLTAAGMQTSDTNMAQNQIRIGHDNLRFNLVHSDFRQYAITGYSVRFIPTNLRGGRDPTNSARASYIHPIKVWDTLDTLTNTALA